MIFKCKSYKILFGTSIMVVFFLLIATILIAQELDNEKSVTISLTKSDVLFAGINNPVIIHIIGYSDQEITTSITNGEITKVDKMGSYTINPKSWGTSVVSVMIGDSIIKETEFKVKPLPSPSFMVANKESGTISKDVLLSQKSVVAQIKNLDIDVKFSVIYFTVRTWNDKAEGYIEAESESNDFTEEQKNILKNLVKNQKIVFENIKVLEPDSSVLMLAPIVLTIE